MLTNIGLVAFVKSKLGTPYVYGMKGAVLTAEKYLELKKLYKDLVWDSDKNKIGKICCDCSGLISWYTGQERSSTQYKLKAKEIHSISCINTAPIGVAVWQQGHIGIYIGDGKYIAADGSAYGVRINEIKNSKFTHWFKICDIEYIDSPLVEQSKIKINGKYYTVSRILVNGTNYIKIRDLEQAGIKISNENDIAVLNW